MRVKAYGKEACHLAIKAVYDAAQTMDNPADLINVALETLVKERFELPAFSTLDRMARRVRVVVNRRFWNIVLSRLTEETRARLDALLVIDPRTKRSPFNRLTQLPKQPSLSHLQEWLDQLEWLVSLGDATDALAGLPPLKVKHFAAEAKALDARELKDFALPKRATLRLSLIQRQRVQARDQLALMLVKRMSKIQQRGKEELERLRVRHREKTAQLVSILADVVTACERAPTDAEAGQLVKTLLAENGDTGQLLEDCASVVAASCDNYQPLLWRYYRSYRRTLFRLIKHLAPASTTRDESLITALNFMLENEDRRGDTLAGAVDLSFASERWQRTVYRVEGGEVLINRRHFEVCVFTHLAAELKSGDVSIEGSDEYADYREQLLAWEECEPLVDGYCRELELPATAQEFVSGLRAWLSETARRVDDGYPENGQLIIDKQGLPTLKRLLGREQPASVKELEAAIISRLPEHNVIDILSNVEHYTGWTRHYGPLSGSDPKLERAVERYLLTAFAYGCNLAPDAGRTAHARDSHTAYALLRQSSPRQRAQTECGLKRCHQSVPPFPSAEAVGCGQSRRCRRHEVRSLRSESVG